MPKAWPAGYDRLELAEVDSTLDEGARRFDTLTGPLWISAGLQTKARGRRGRAWANPTGNFAGTLVLPVAGESPDRIALRSFVAALALYDALVLVSGRTDPFALKWPNDVLMNGGKLAGILLESVLRRNRVEGLMIGIGVNLAEAPQPEQLEARALRPVSLLSEAGVQVSTEDFLTALAASYARLEDMFRTQGFAPIRRAWLDRATRLGQEITARFGSDSLTGRFETIDDNGHLVLTVDGQRHAIAAADVYF
ncbi:biotin--[acetyl-CoA-carboxylase] ligase [Pseudooceanicola sp. CBS1P-1]|uniref:biotin--[biotin carboxyl-carrier protein] ligase n=1 Tax=Pseudooceanicola albus TaxID=2692189 RepID=A0A6L7G0N3_9RHOB|nr:MULTISPECIES: biotin--[acetyl-CoA-carboxylase] ligase [Pseudooceanicola]MBT9382517.1 biotin--[acetyl-CoA-carboxylase] ligase [Pseudooceanicola endophyticus]MXN17058.1 biotin--[acetyl-CoA-carboxylase] ligase [Pseudooceanicola albus]